MAVLRTEQDIINDAMAEMRVPVLADTAATTLYIRQAALHEANALMVGAARAGRTVGREYMETAFPKLVLLFERYLVTGSFDDANAEPSPSAAAET